VCTSGGRDKGRGGERADSPLSGEPDAGLHPGTLDHDPSQKQVLNRLSQPGAQEYCSLAEDKAMDAGGATRACAD